MILVKNLISEDTLTLSAPNMPNLQIPLKGCSKKSLLVHVWKDECSAYSCGEEAKEWFSAFLGTSTRLVYMPRDSRRVVDPNFTISHRLVSFADGYPFLLLSEASLEDLNRRLPMPIEMMRFRPNLVISGCKAYEEDSWRTIRIGAIQFQLVKACSRCVITTIHLDKGTSGIEPLRTLSSYRMEKGRVLFGQNAVHEGEGLISVGLPVEIID